MRHVAGTAAPKILVLYGIMMMMMMVERVLLVRCCNCCCKDKKYLGEMPRVWWNLKRCAKERLYLCEEL